MAYGGRYPGCEKKSINRRSMNINNMNKSDFIIKDNLELDVLICSANKLIKNNGRCGSNAGIKCEECPISKRFRIIRTYCNHVCKIGKERLIYAKNFIKLFEEDKMEERKCVMTLAVAQQMFKSGDSILRTFALDNFTQKELERKLLPTSFKELGHIKGFYALNSREDTSIAYESSLILKSKELFATSEQAKASLALAQLSQLMKVYNKGWIPDWKRGMKYVIYYNNDNIFCANVITPQRFLTFETPEIRDEFFCNFRDLIEQAKPLL